MYFLILGVALLLLKYLEVGPVAAWSWYVVLGPFALAAAWWAFADWSGYTKRKAMEREDAKKAARIAKAKEVMHGGRTPTSLNYLRAVFCLEKLPAMLLTGLLKVRRACKSSVANESQWRIFH